MSPLAAAEKVVAGKTNKGGPRPYRFCRSPFMARNSQRFSSDFGGAAEIFNKRNPLFPCECADLLPTRRFDKTAHGKIAAMHFKNHRCLRPDGMLVILERSFVRRADFA